MAAGEARVALALRSLFLLRFYVAPLCLRPSLHTLACCLLCTCSGSLCVADAPRRDSFVFAPSS